jgi:hypothetical protein
VHVRESINPNPLSNFSYLCELGLQEQYELYFFCDHDDIWHGNKIADYVEALNDLQTVHRGPVALYSDPRLIDGGGNHLFGSFKKYQGSVRSVHKDLMVLMHQNSVPGCTIAMNWDLMRLGTPVPAQATMHDHWFVLLACVSGLLVELSGCHLSYRQHKRNYIGAKKPHRLTSLLSLEGVRRLICYPLNFIRSVKQSGLILSRISERGLVIDSMKKEGLESVYSLLSANIYDRLTHRCVLFPHQRRFFEVIFIVFVLSLLPIFKSLANVDKK